MINSVVEFTDGRVFLKEEGVKQVSKVLPSGIYGFEYENFGRFVNFTSTNIPKVYSLMPSTEIKNIQQYLDIFFSEKHIKLCAQVKMYNKSGVLLYGNPGIGKSNYINSILLRCITKEACIFNIADARDLYNCIEKVKELRRIQNNLFVILLEEMDELIDKSTEGALKNFMDGINSIENCLFLGSTNYIDKIPKSLIERPSRFKKVFEIKPSSDIEEMKEWLKSLYKDFIPNISDENIEILHDSCLNKTVEEVKHILIDHCLKIDNINTKRKIGF